MLSREEAQNILNTWFGEQNTQTEETNRNKTEWKTTPVKEIQGFLFTPPKRTNRLYLVGNKGVKAFSPSLESVEKAIENYVSES